MTLAEAGEKIAHGVGAGKTPDAKQGVKGFVCPKPIRMGKATGPGHHRDHEGDKGLGWRDGVGAGVSEWHQPTNLSGQPNLLEEGDETDKTTERRDGFRGGSEPDLPSGENGIKRSLHRLVKRCGVR